MPSQRQLDSARKILSTYEEQGVYDMFRLPFLMPNTGNTPPASDDEVLMTGMVGMADLGPENDGANHGKPLESCVQCSIIIFPNHHFPHQTIL